MIMSVCVYFFGQGAQVSSRELGAGEQDCLYIGGLDSATIALEVGRFPKTCHQTLYFSNGMVLHSGGGAVSRIFFCSSALPRVTSEYAAYMLLGLWD